MPHYFDPSLFSSLWHWHVPLQHVTNGHILSPPDEFPSQHLWPQTDCTPEENKPMSLHVGCDAHTHGLTFRCTATTSQQQ